VSQIREQLRVAAWSPDEKRVALATDGAVDVHDAWSGELLRELRHLPHRVEAMLFSPDGTQLAVLGDGPKHDLQLWLHPLGDGAPVRCLGGLHGAAERVLAFSPDGTRLAVHIVTFFADHERMSAVVWRGKEPPLIAWQERGLEWANLPVRRIAFDPSRPDALLVWLDGVVERWSWDPHTPLDEGVLRGAPARETIRALPHPEVRKSFSAPLPDGRVAFGPRWEAGPAGIAALSGETDEFSCAGASEIALAPDGICAGLVGHPIHDDPVSVWSRLPGKAAERHDLGKTGFASLSPSGRLLVLGREPGKPEILSVAGDRIDLSEEARLRKVARPRARASAALRKERRTRTAALLDAGFSEEAVEAHRAWLAASGVELWALEATAPPLPEKTRAGLLRFFRKARNRWLEPRVEHGLVSLRPWQGHIPWKYKQRLPALVDDRSLSEAQAITIAGDELAYGPRSANPLAARLAKSRHARNLVDLEWSGMGISAAGIRSLARSKHLQGLRRLSIHWEQLGAGAVEIARSFPALTHLELDFCLARDERLFAAMKKAPWAKRLLWLDLPGNGLTDAAARVLAEAPFAPTLRFLGLGKSQGSNSLGREGAKAIAAGPFRSLFHLDLSENEIGAAGLAALLASPVLKTVVHLGLDSAGLDAKALALLAERGPDALPNLRVLRLASQKLSAKAVEALLSTPFCSRLTTLDLSWNSLGDDGARALAASPHLGKLEVLSAGYSKIDDLSILENAERLPASAKDTLLHPPWLGPPSGLAAQSRYLAR
jgi:hypothetical protein